MKSLAMVLLVLGFTVVACRRNSDPPPVMVGSFSLNAGRWSSDQQELGRRASFDLQCQQVSLVVLSTGTYFGTGPHDDAAQIGAQGCGRQATYVRAPGSGWVANMSAGQAAPPPPVAVQQ